MTSKYQSSANSLVSVNSKITELSSLRQQKNNPNSKKLFSRKPIKNSQNCSRMMLGRLKIQQEEQNYQQNPDFNNCLKKFIKPSKSIKFVSTKSSQSRQKLLSCSSAQQLPTISELRHKKQVSDQEKVYKFNSYNKLNQSPIFKEDLELKYSQFNLIYDSKKDDQNSKDLLGSTELSSNQNICNQDFNEDDFKNYQLQRSKSNQTFYFYYPKDTTNTHTECPNCVINSQKIKELHDINQKLSQSISDKELELRKLNERNQKLSRNLSDSEISKASLEYEIRILKEKESFLSSQKDEIDNAFKKLQASFAKLNQEMKYKDLELNIHKIYKTKSHEMEMKVETLKHELKKSKNTMTKIMNLKSSQSLIKKNLKTQPNIMENFKRQDSQKRLKKPKIARVYSEDIIFTLSSEEWD